jgi:hypothetical protein
LRKSAGLLATSTRTTPEVRITPSRFTACSTARTVAIGTRNVAPPYSISIAAELTITDAKLSRSLAIADRPRACQRQVNNCGGIRPCRRATALDDSVQPILSASIAAFCSVLNVRRRPAPVKISTAVTTPT